MMRVSHRNPTRQRRKNVENRLNDYPALTHWIIIYLKAIEMDQLLESFSGTHMMVAGAALLVGLFTFRRTAKRLATSRNRNPYAEVKREMLKREQSQRGSMQELEVRIHNFAREAEATIQTRLSQLAEQTSQADATITRLENELTTLKDDNLTGEERLQQSAILQLDQYANSLTAAGYSAEEVALMIGRPDCGDDKPGYSNAA